MSKSMFSRKQTRQGTIHIYMHGMRSWRKRGINWYIIYFCGLNGLDDFDTLKPVSCKNCLRVIDSLKKEG